ncbi:MAG: pyridoxal phosphate-dependent aminotransferase [Anaerolineales bacterium]|nr:pyridoxal phosphate-dependent aminotransferase [Anaerolineales bacterium]
MTILNSQFDRIGQSPTVAMADRVAALRAQGRRLIGLQTGDPDFPTHQAILDEAQRAMQTGWTHYVPSRGLPELRTAAAEKLARDHGVQFDPGSEILVTHGGVHAYYCALQSVLNPGDEVLIADPGWATHANMVVMLHGKAIPVPSSAEDGFLPALGAWQNVLTSRTRAVVINWPNNPTGALPPREYILSLQDFAVKNGLWVISDEVYEALVYDGCQHVCAASIPGARERTLVVNSLSKTYAMTGWRIGFLAAPAKNIDNALKASQNSITCIAPFIQKAAAFALTDPGVQEAVREMKSAYARRRSMVLEIASNFASKVVGVSSPKGAFYFFLDMRALRIPSLEICERLLEDVSVALVPGSAFGPSGEGFVRMVISASDEDVQTGMELILEWADHQVRK